MTNYLKIKESVEKNHVLELSSSFTKATAVLSAIILSFLFLMVLYRVVNNPGDTDGSLMILFLLSGVMTALSIYQLLHAADAKLKGKELILKTMLGKTYQVHINEIQSLSSFALKSTKYTVVKFYDEDNNMKTILILSSNSIFNSDTLSVKDIIEMAQKI